MSVVAFYLAGLWMAMREARRPWFRASLAEPDGEMSYGLLVVVMMGGWVPLLIGRGFKDLIDWFAGIEPAESQEATRG